jgi:hypothetical protein
VAKPDALRRDEKWLGEDGLPLCPAGVPCKFVAAARNEWQTRFGCVWSAPMTAVVDGFVVCEGRHSEQLRINFAHLLSREMSIESLMTNEVTFEAFVQVFLKFWSRTGFTEQLEALTPADCDSAGGCAQFDEGICLGMDRLLLFDLWNRAPADTWALLDGPDAGSFRLMMKSSGSSRVRRILIDPTAARGRFTVETDSGAVIASDIQSVLNCFGLRKECGLMGERLPSVSVSPTPAIEPDCDCETDWRSDALWCI